MIEDGTGAAVEALSAAVSTQPGRGELWSELAKALVAAGRAPEAWDAAVRAVELAPRSAASHRAIGTVAAALGDPAQAESAYRYAGLLEAGSAAEARSPHAGALSGGRHASDRATALAAWMANQLAAPDPPLPAPAGAAADPAVASRPARSRHAAPDEDGTTTGRHGIPEPSTAGRRRAPELDHAAADRPVVHPEAAPDGGPATAVWSSPAPSGGPAWAGAHSAGGSAWAGAGSAGGSAAGWPGERRATAVGLPAWLGPVGPTPGPDGWARAVPAGGTRLADPVAWRRGLVTVVRIEWLAGVACFLGLASASTAPSAAVLLAGALVVAGWYGRLRWRATSARRPPEPDRVPTYAAVAAAATAVVIVPAVLAGALTLARVAAVAVVTSATVAAVLLTRPVGKDSWP